MVEGCGHVQVTVCQNEKRPLETGEEKGVTKEEQRFVKMSGKKFDHSSAYTASSSPVLTEEQQCIMGDVTIRDKRLVCSLPKLSGRHVVTSEEAVPGVTQVLTKLLIQLLQSTQNIFLEK